MWYAWMPAVVVQRLNPWISVDNQRENMNKMNEHHETLRDVDMVWRTVKIFLVVVGTQMYSTYSAIGIEVWGLEELPDAQVWRSQLHLKVRIVGNFLGITLQWLSRTLGWAGHNRGESTSNMRLMRIGCSRRFQRSLFRFPCFLSYVPFDSNCNLWKFLWKSFETPLNIHWKFVFSQVVLLHHNSLTSPWPQLADQHITRSADPPLRWIDLESVCSAPVPRLFEYMLNNMLNNMLKNMWTNWRVYMIDVLFYMVVLMICSIISVYHANPDVPNAYLLRLDLPACLTRN